MTNRREFLAGALGSLGAAAAPLSSMPLAPCVLEGTAVHVFGKSDAVPWISRPIREDAPATSQAFLRRDETTGLAVLVAFPAGWKTTELVYYKSDEAIFVLGGDFGIGGNVLGPGQYCYLPYGMVRRDLASLGGSLVIAFFGQISRHYHADAATEIKANQGLEVIDPWQAPWQPVSLTNVPDPASVVLAKPVHLGPEARIYLVSLLPGFVLPAEYAIEPWQEWFVLSGSLLVRDCDCGPGTYGFLAAGERLGPVCTASGVLALVRFPGTARLQILPSTQARQAAHNYVDRIQYLPRPG